LEVQDIKISLITVTHNAERTISRCIESVIAQNYKNIECIIIDGGSTDGTIQIIDRYKDHINIFISEPDDGVYDAMNKGIMLAHGDIIGTLNADDYFAADDILALVASAFSDHEGADILYGDLDYVDLDETIIRKWRTKRYVKGIYNWGWMPPHPTFYCRRLLFDRFGFYSLEYGTAADYELMLRFMHFNNTGGLYINKVMIKMQCGGMSNKSPINRIKAWGFDIKAMRNNGISYPLLTLIIKPLRKIAQYL
jgi:glycosyltransferase involved in cell wall biosynthesis